jgi:hypothetical protein
MVLEARGLGPPGGEGALWERDGQMQADTGEFIVLDFGIDWGAKPACPQRRFRRDSVSSPT